MDELLYLLALVVGIVGSFAFWRYGRSRKRAVVRAIQKEREK
ncbi:hypothetical protein [Effusibacillus consociatus]|uniref:LPXTG cell wall anchor domain-containing protein n=1 Tax=Effusibacillus consociatus TaxID=1117041 RepID=A0ABV9Q672_9BACL